MVHLYQNDYRPVSIVPNFSKNFPRLLDKIFFEFLDNILPEFQCGFVKGYRNEHCLLLIHYELCTLCARSPINSLNRLQKYLSNYRQRTKVDFVYSSWDVTLSGVTQVLILGPILLSILIYVMF